MKKWMMAAAGAALMFSCAGQVMADQLQDIQKRGVLRVAVPQDFPPLWLGGNRPEAAGL